MVSSSLIWAIHEAAHDLVTCNRHRMPYFIREIGIENENMIAIAIGRGAGAGAGATQSHTILPGT